MQKLKTIIVENDPKSLSLLLSLISDYCAELEVIYTATNVKEATKQILNHQPDLIFLDMELDDGSGLDVLYQIPNKKFKTIVISGFSHYAINAFKFQVIHYLLKPISIRDLRIAVDRALQSDIPRGNQDAVTEKAEENANSQKKVQISTNDGIKLINLNDIAYFQADGNYTVIHLINKDSLLASRHLKTFESILAQNNFYRIGRTHIVNLDFIKGYNKNGAGVITMGDGCSIAVPRRKKDDFIQYLNSYLKVIK